MYFSRACKTLKQIIFRLDTQHVVTLMVKPTMGILAQIKYEILYLATGSVYSVVCCNQLTNTWRLSFSNPLKMSETIDDMSAYTQLEDSIFLRILHSSEPQLEPAREILRNIECRRLYKFIGQTKRKQGTEDRVCNQWGYLDLSWQC